jgi:hypothetical protein
MTHTPLGLWLDGGPAELGHMHELRPLGITTAAIMVETSRPEWDPSWSTEQVARACEIARDEDLELVLTVWPAPRRAYLYEMRAWLDRVCGLGVSAIEVDLERLWMRDHLDGSLDSLTQAAALLLLRLRELAGAHDLRLEVTSHPWHGEASPQALVAPHVDRLVQQAYSIRRRPDGAIVDWDDHRLGPGHHQRWAAADARTVPGVAQGLVGLSLGLPLWEQAWPGHEPAEALGLAYDAAVAEGVSELRFWSTLNLRKHGWARAWLEGLRAG